MSFVDQLKERMRGKSAEEAIEALAKRGAIDDHLARKFIVIEEYEHRYGNSDATTTSVRGDLAFEFGLSEEAVRTYTGR